MEINTILVSTDFSEEADNALDLAVSIAKKRNAKITLFHVVDVPPAISGGLGSGIGSVGGAGIGGATDSRLHDHYVHKLLEVVKYRIGELINRYSDAGVTIQEQIIFDNKSKKLATFIAENEADLIMVASQCSQLEDHAIHLTIEQIIRKVKKPVFIVKNRAEHPQMGQIVFASDFKKINREAVEELKMLQEIFDAQLHLLTVIKSLSMEDKAQKRMKEFAQLFQLEKYTINTYKDNSTEHGIRAFSNSINADMISMITHGRTGLAHLLYGSIAEKVANHAKRSVLTFNQHE
ncbi:universal stress protein [Rapidithrix thailandica]|uniref:Universal stress protein n=1 Tax=Rapidithrix thailandica TaxID=413964 RepID=A0AAW9RWB8_9BACT